MKRLILAVLLVGVGLTGLVALRPGTLAGQEGPYSSYSKPADPPACAGKDCKDKQKTAGSACCGTKNDAEVVGELVKILNETKSADTFVATLLALSQFEDKSPLPAVVKNAARLGLLKGLSKDENPPHAQQMVAAYLSGEMAAECNPEFLQRYGGVPAYGYTQPVTRYMAPPAPTCVPMIPAAPPPVPSQPSLSTWGVTTPVPAATAAESVRSVRTVPPDRPAVPTSDFPPAPHKP